jgi:hypothetical protein
MIKITGSAHASNLFTRPDAIKWTAGEAHKKINYLDRDFTMVFLLNVAQACLL